MRAVSTVSSWTATCSCRCQKTGVVPRTAVVHRPSVLAPGPGGSIEAPSMATLWRRRRRTAFNAITGAVVVFPFGKRILAVVDITSVMGLENEEGARPPGRTASRGRPGWGRRPACLPFERSPASCSGRSWLPADRSGRSIAVDRRGLPRTVSMRRAVVGERPDGGRAEPPRAMPRSQWPWGPPPAGRAAIYLSSQRRTCSDHCAVLHTARASYGRLDRSLSLSLSLSL
jgi:hypothetical protein